jgi:hypothetical protein
MRLTALLFDPPTHAPYQVQCEHVNIPGHIVQLETQINELEKEQQYNENKTKLEELKEMLSKEKKS